MIVQYPSLSPIPVVTLQENTGIKTLNLSMNGFGLPGAEALEDMLKV